MMNPLEISQPSSPPEDPPSSTSRATRQSNKEHRQQRERVEEADAAVEMEITFEEDVGGTGEDTDEVGVAESGEVVPVAADADADAGADEEAMVPLAGLIRHNGSKDSDDGLSSDPSSSPSCRRRRRGIRRCCRRPEKVGNCTVICPALYDATGVGVVGPHWPGLACTFALLWGAASYFTRMALIKSHRGHGAGEEGEGGGGADVVRYEWSAIPVVSVIFCAVCTVGLVLTACADPGVVTRGDDRQRRYREAMPGGGGRDGGWRWCDICRVFQPPRAVHCPDCNLCVDGYDHHCPWMGTCIGRRNMRAFVAFNLSWLFYLIFVVGWVVRIFERKK